MNETKSPRRLTLRRFAGAGGFGNVWRAENEAGIAVALKADPTNDTYAARRIAAEAMWAALALSPRLPSLVDVGWLDPDELAHAAPGRSLVPRSRGPGVPFAAFSWVEGVPVSARHMDRAAAIDLALDVAADVGEALADLHGVGIAHGDVKPENVLRDAAGRLHLIDLGLATPASSTEVEGLTLRYAATRDPELGDARSRDLIALGVVLAELAAPEVAAAADAITAARTVTNIAPLDRIVAALVSVNPAARPSAAWVTEVAGALRANRSPRDRASDRAERDARAVRATYLRLRRHAWSNADRAAPGTAPWLADAILLAKRAAEVGGARPGSASEPDLDRTGNEVGALPPEGIAAWLVLLCGPHAAAWPIEPLVGVGEASLAEALVALARRCTPAAWTFRDVEEAAWGKAQIDPTNEADLRGDEVAERPMGAERASALALALSAVPPDPRALTAVEVARDAPAQLVRAAADALRRRGEFGRAAALVAREGSTDSRGARGFAAELRRRAGDLDGAAVIARSAIAAADDDDGRAAAVLGRIALDAGRRDEAAGLVAAKRTAALCEVAALCAVAASDIPGALADVARGEALSRTPEERARFAAVRGYAAHGRDPEATFAALTTATEYAVRAGAVVEEATYRMGQAAAAVDIGELGAAVTAGRRSALLWEALGRPAMAARALLACAAAHATAGAKHETITAAERARERAEEGGDRRAIAYAWWCVADAVFAGDPAGKHAAEAADEVLGAIGSPDPDDVLRGAARLRRHASPRLTPARLDAAITGASDPARSVAVRLEWWGAHAEALVGASPHDPLGASNSEAQMMWRAEAERTVTALVTLADARAPVGARAPALFAGQTLAARLGKSEPMGRLRAACREAGAVLLRRAGIEWSAMLRVLPWISDSNDAAADDIRPEQGAELARIVHTLSDREHLRTLLDRIVDALVLWTGAERGLLLLHAPNGKLVPRAARNLARADLAGEQLALSHTLAQRALDTRAPVVAVDAIGEMSVLHPSVHALKLRSVLALPLVARGEALGVAYLDDRLRRGAFGARELTWATTISQLAAVAISDARREVMLRRAVRRAQRASADLAEALAQKEAQVDSLSRELSRSTTGRDTRYRYDRIVGDSEPIRGLLAIVDRVTATDVPVLITGESGSGKELIARAVHDNGARAARPFVAENCGAIPETLLESALFGHVRGAFTGADRPRAGLFEAADRGTLFLDEIGEMSLTMQTRLLRVLEDGLVRPVGGERTRKVDVRIIAATNRDLEAMVKARTFREDLFYRLNIITLKIPPLRARPSDIPLLLRHFLKAFGQGREIAVTKAALGHLVHHSWPGNVRQLENEIRRAIVLSDGTIDVEHLSQEVRGAPVGRAADGYNLKDRIDGLETELVKKALERTKGNQTQAARLLGLSRFGLQKMMKRLGIATSAVA